MSDLIRIAPTEKEFEANGKIYRVEDSLSVARYRAFEKLHIELAFGLEFSTLFARLRSIYDLWNADKKADALIALYQLMTGLTLIDEKRPIALYVATLFINTADEDRAKWTVALAEEKLAAWSNIDVDFFLTVALSRVRGFAEAYRSVSDLSTTLSSPESS